MLKSYENYLSKLGVNKIIFEYLVKKNKKSSTKIQLSYYCILSKINLISILLYVGNINHWKINLTYY